MAQQVKFYAVTAESYASIATKNAGALYFITDTKQIYKGSDLYGAARVFTATAGQDTASITGMVQGDILTGIGAAKVYDGSKWVDMGADFTNLTLTASTTDGTVQIYDGTTAVGSSVVVPGFSSVNAVITGNATDGYTVSAATGSFTNLTVTSTATFEATTIDASTITASNITVTDTITTASIVVGDSTIEQIAYSQAEDAISAITASTISATSNGITVSVTTQSGTVTNVELDASALEKVMNFKGTVIELPSDDDSSNGDIVVIRAAGDGETLGNDEDGNALVEGQEYIYVKNGDEEGKWELIGDQSTINTISETATTTAGSVTTLMGGSTTAGSVDNKIAAAISDATMNWLDANNSAISE